MSSRPATSVSLRALATVWRRPTLPAAMVRPTMAWRSSARAISRARASSTPGSVSISRGILSIHGFYAGGAPSDGRLRGKGLPPALLDSVLTRRSGGRPFPLRAPRPAQRNPEEGRGPSGGGVAGGAADPAGDEGVGDRRRFGEEAVAEGVHLRQQVGVAGEVGEAEAGQAGLAGAEQLARTAQGKILFRDLESVVGGAHGFEALLRQRRQRRLVQQHATGGRAAAPDPPAQLVQLRQAQALRILDDHQRRV